MVSDRPDWLDETMIFEALGGPKTICDVLVNPAIPYGEHYLSTILRVEVTYKEFETIQETTFIVKTFPPGELKEFTRRNGMFAKELKMYTCVLPIMCDILNEYIIPKCVKSTNEDVIILEDLTVGGFEMCNRINGLDYEHCVYAIKVLADFHGASYIMNQKYPEIISSIEKEMLYTKENESQQTFVFNCFKIVANEIQNWPSCEKYASRLCGMRNKIWDDSITEIAPTENEIMVLNHGDFWTNNLMFRYEDNNIAELKLVDFQFSRYTTPAIDLQIFFTLSLRDHQLATSLIDVYLECFNKHIHPQKMTKDELQRALQRTECFSFLLSVCFLPLILLDPSKAIKAENIDPEMKDEYDNNSLCIVACKDDTFKNVFPKFLEHYEAIGLL